MEATQSPAGGGALRLSFGGGGGGGGDDNHVAPPVAVVTHADTSVPLLEEVSVQCSDEILGRGASGVVRCGTMQPPSGGPPVPVAVKELAPGASAPEQESFMREFRIAFTASQHCRNACYIHGCVHRGNALCLVMKRYTRSLADILEERRGATPLNVTEALPIALEMAMALEQLHKAEIVVRDLKPNNVLLDEDGRYVISDFGIAKAVGSLSQATATTGRAKGTTSYMSPEMFDRNLVETTGKADVWAWGCVMVEMLAGERPWQGIQDMQVMHEVTIKKNTPQVPADLPPRLDALLRRCFAYTAADRPSASEVSVEVQAVASNLDAHTAADLAAVPPVVWAQVRELVAQQVVGARCRWPWLPPGAVRLQRHV